MEERLLFLFDLDSTITKVEILPEISKMVGIEQEMTHLTEEAMNGSIPFRCSFLKRVELLRDIKVDMIAEKIAQIPLNERIVDFIKSNKKQCYILTGNLDVWISQLMTRIGMEDHCICSRACVDGNSLKRVISVLDKGKAVQQFVQPFVAIGDGDNDTDMARQAKIAIGFGGVRTIAPSLLANSDYTFYSENELVDFLWKIAERNN